MANVARIVTNQEVTKFVPSITSIEDGSGDAIVVKTVEAHVFSLLANRGINPVKTAYTSEEVDIYPESLQFNHVLTKGVTAFKTKFRPVTKFNSIKIINSRDQTTGAILTSDTVPRNSYKVTQHGVVSMISPSINFQSFFWYVFPSGMGSMVIDYEAGYDIAASGILDKDCFSILKLLILQMISRYHQLQRQELWFQQGVSAAAGTISTFIRKDLTPEEQSLFNAFVESV